MLVVMNNKVKYEVFLKMSLSSPDKIRQPNIIPTIHIPPKNSPEKIMPPGTDVNLKITVVKSPTDKSPSIIFSLWSVITSFCRLCSLHERMLFNC
jgi:hypothetical protein